MPVKIFILFIVPLASGLVAYLIPKLSSQLSTLLLVFGGSYLFSFMLLHLLPELFAHTPVPWYETLGLCLLLGFFLQILLDFFSGGIAHGHMELSESIDLRKYTKILPLFLALSIHALLDGCLLGISIPHANHNHHHSLLMGILLHKIPISFTLPILLKNLGCKTKIIFLCLILFALISPLGWYIADSLERGDIFSWQIWLIIRSIAIGNLLHIATTILFESTPHHHLDWKKLAAILTGGFVAITML